jgi:hypothetical protein
MSQICHGLQYMHKQFVGCFLKLSDIIICEGGVVKIRGLGGAYAVEKDSGWKEFSNRNN